MNMHVLRPFLSGVLALAALVVGAAVPLAPASAEPPWTGLAMVRDVDNGALQPFRELINVNLNAGETFKTANGSVVPDNKRLVIENVSVWAFSVNSADVATGIWLSPLNISAFTLLDPATTERKSIGGGAAVAAYNRQVKLYFNPGETLQAWVFFEGTNASKTVNIYLSGYYVNLP